MQWDFTFEEVVRGEINYGLIEFRRDLLAEIQTNFNTDDPEFIKHSFNMIYELCHWLATGRELEDFISTLPDDKVFDSSSIRSLEGYMQDNITMLGAILQRMIMNGVEKGGAIDDVINTVAREHKNIINEDILLS